MFGDEMSLAMRLIVALVIILALIGFVVLILKKFGVGRLGTISGHGRQPRLAVMDIAHLDSRRKLVIVRRDMVEHLVMIGGPNDVVIETGIVRGQSLGPSDHAMPQKQARSAPPEPQARIAPTFTSSIKAAASEASAEPRPTAPAPSVAPEPLVR